MVFAVQRETTVGGHDRLDAAVHEQLPWVPISATVRGRNVPEGEIPLPLADPVKARGWGSVDVRDPAEVVIREKLSNVDLKLKDFVTGNDASAVAAVFVRLNAELRKAARSDRSAALNVEIAAQEAAAKALRSSGLCQLFGAIATSGGAILGAGVNLKGARQIQARFDEVYKAKIQAPLPKSRVETPTPNSPSGQAQRFDKSEGELELRDEPHGKGQIIQAPERDAWSSQDDIEMTRLNSSRSNTLGDPHRLDAPNSTTDPLEFTRVVQAQTEAQQEAMRWNGMGTIATEAFKLPGAGLNMGATHYQEEEAQLQADSTRAQAQMENESEFLASYETTIQDVLGELAEIRRADSEARSKIVSMA
ncbi:MULTISPECIES: hypothetical protein [Bradyrhizobium]|uniref:Uncharacterized protein n=1 Tax=Bradyrhizobium frederickii TaxID=2560054 RepID=A0A4Y9KRV7_9BRAD|nr:MULTISPECIES: hypothetical protein [Bradyrhizobium]RTE88300.1 hypothetical protein D6B98_36560 [Bradyrhizobium sp. LVM 105]TFV29483.1 hypothetical protein E4K66_37550 [Bradyrhizobium frederickii]TFV68046.1 hypothetical protein E4K64_37570 [Bradyrhizobium frederickii]